MGTFSTESKGIAVEGGKKSQRQSSDARARHRKDKMRGKGEYSTTKHSCFAQYGYREVAG
jgi:hypothetical protein